MALLPDAARAAPTAEVARKCISYSYLAYPYQRPGAAKMNGNRQAYINHCLSQGGDVARPVTPGK